MSHNRIFQKCFRWSNFSLSGNFFHSVQKIRENNTKQSYSQHTEMDCSFSREHNCELWTMMIVPVGLCLEIYDRDLYLGSSQLYWLAESWSSCIAVGKYPLPWALTWDSCTCPQPSTWRLSTGQSPGPGESRFLFCQLSGAPRCTMPSPSASSATAAWTLCQWGFHPAWKLPAPSPTPRGCS